MLRTAGPLVLGLLAMLPFAAVAQKKAAGSSSALQTLIAREWQYQLEHSPTYASVLGDRRWNGLWDDLSLEAIEADHRHNVQVLKELDAFKGKRLSAKEQLDYELLRRDYQTWVDEHRFRWFLVPISSMSSLPEGVKQAPGVQVAYQLADTLRFATVKDYADWIQRMEGFGTYVDQTIALMRQGMAEKRIHPKAVMQRVPRQVEVQRVKDPAKSGFYSPFTRFPASIPQAEQQRLSDEAKASIARTVLPSLERFHTFLVKEYIPAAPEQVGVWQVPDGEAMYAAFARRSTTTSLTPEEIHQLGLSEVKRLRAEMEAVKARAGFKGTLPEFFTFLRTSKEFYYPSGAELLLHYRDLAKRIDPRLVRLFRTLPRAPYGVEPTPEAMAPDVTTGFYYPASADGSRPGTYLVNLYKPETRPRWEMVPLTLHESVPGHHLQTSLAAEQTGLPEFRRYGYYMAYGEGWALYCETLGDELGLYDDPYDKFGQLAYEMWRAVRLVVDTGMHQKHWTRQQAIAFFMENSPRQELDVTNEVDRYIAMPGQALAYKIGQLKIRELRNRAEKALGERFDVRAFHDAVLLEGSLPMDVLERRIDQWIAAQSK
ncbi:DUF885 domain-containing protein [Aggregicoccus sp. 17bor-14]|uniref:DUF885 domain-containing protein n=1 Tax=Myxococcaceae TaxID=31 RepID=UPI00129C508B|nr:MULTISPECIES: DUF885 domain-containing protein [Myxococcaceae]MBF5041641.1 DUF885 domain-containing protein [Simulacricoccus sp. 17bor-14]MRI87425.1 DUF885 domain-containing protein [Aggregicoccus sp. 17bor-14]